MNLSTGTHPRVELKGVSSLSSLPQVLRIQLDRMKSSDQTRVSTRVIRDGGTEFMRYPTGHDRMDRETELEPLGLRVTRRDPMLMGLNPSTKAQVLKFIKDPRTLRRLDRYHRRGEFSGSDWPVLRVCLGMGGLGVYDRYVKDLITGQGLLKGQWIQPLGQEELEAMRHDKGSFWVLKNHRQRLSRSYRARLGSILRKIQ